MKPSCKRRKLDKVIHLYTYGKKDTMDLQLEQMSDLSDDVETICPILQDRFDECVLDCASDLMINPKNPALCIAKLPCGHRFSALGVLYSMAISSLRCPCCRFGFDKKINLTCLPKHLRETFKTAIATSRINVRIPKNQPF
jgi:hypothetical protein